MLAILATLSVRLKEARAMPKKLSIKGLQVAKEKNIQRALSDL